VDLSRGLLDFPARSRGLAEVHKADDRFLMALSDVLAVIVLVDEVGERVVDIGPAMRQRTVGIG
jgi:hypothetical protein